MALAFAPATVSLNIHEDLPVQNGLMSRSITLLSIGARPSFTQRLRHLHNVNPALSDADFHTTRSDEGLR